MMRVTRRGRTISLRKTVLIILVISFIFTTFSLLARHYNFKTSAYDTGIQAGVARNIAFNGSFYNEVMDINHLADHFAPALALPGLLFYIWDNPAVVLIFQNICIFLSIIIAFYLAREILKDDIPALLLSFMYAINVYLTGINTTDYHIDTLAMPLLLILLWLIEKDQSWKTLTLVILVSLGVLTIKEDFPLALAGLGIFVLLFRRGKRASGWIMFLIGGLGFYVILKYLMPGGSETGYMHINYYTGLGDSTSDVVKNILTRPDIVIKNLVTPPEKLLRPLLLIISFLFLPLFAPVELCSAAVPIFYQLISSYRHQYMFHSHYAAPALPFLFYSSIYGFRRARELLNRMSERGRPGIRKAVLLAAALLLAVSAISTISSYARNIIRYDSRLYQTFDNNVKSLIPESSRVISTNHLQPHFIGYARSGRLWRFSDLESDPDYIVIYLRQNSLSWPDSVYHNFLAEYRERYKVSYEDADFLVFDLTDKPE